MIKLSIIIPCYNAEPYIYELLDTLAPQITKEVEVILIDDGSKDPVYYDLEGLKIYRQKNSGVSKSRNRGLELAKGKIISFIDADDLVAKNFVDYILSRYEEEWDYMDLSWKSLEDNKYMYKLSGDSDSLPNPSASTRVFRRSFIGDVRFPEKKDAAEDECFTRRLGLKFAKHICAPDYMYFYRVTTPCSTTKRYMEGLTNTKRIGYYFKKVTKDMTYLIDEFKREDEVNEVFLLTDCNEIPELEKYCQVKTPIHQIKVMEARGENCRYFAIMPQTYITQVVIYKSNIGKAGGIETFIYSFCKRMSKYYDITVLCDNIDPEQHFKLHQICPVLKNDNRTILCDTLIINSLFDKTPKNVNCKKSVQMVHCLKQLDWTIPKDRDVIVHVSQASKDSFGGESGEVIHNLTSGDILASSLLLVSTFRVGARDKHGNDERCIKFAKLLEKAGIDYIWLYFSDKPINNAPKNMIFAGLRQEIRPYIARADYLVQLSGAEAFSYSLLEALEQQTPVIVTPLAQNEEMGIVDGLNAYVVPFEVDGFDVKQILNVPRVCYTHDNNEIIKQWRKLLGNTKPKGDYKPLKEVRVIVTSEYRDIQRNELMKLNTECSMPYARALELQSKGFVRII